TARERAFWPTGNGYRDCPTEGVLKFTRATWAGKSRPSSSTGPICCQPYRRGDQSRHGGYWSRGRSWGYWRRRRRTRNQLRLASTEHSSVEQPILRSGAGTGSLWVFRKSYHSGQHSTNLILMPLASDRSGGINTSDISGIGVGGLPPTPAVEDLMQAFRSGFLTVDDAIRRGLSLPVEAETQRQNHADQREIRPLARQAQAGALSNEITIQPRRQALAMGQTEAAIRALPTEAESIASDAARAKAAAIATGLASPDVDTRLRTVANLTTDQVLDAWTAASGAPPPERLEVPDPDANTNTPAPIDEWFLNSGGTHPAGTSAVDNLNRPEIQAAYQQYVKEVKSRPLTLFKGTPEYY